MVLPFPVHHSVGNEFYVLPVSLGGQSTSGDQDMEMGIELPRSSEGLQYHHATDIKGLASRGLKDVEETGMASPHQFAEQVGALIEPVAEEVRGGQNEVAVGDSRKESASDEVSPLAHPWLCTREAKAGLAGEGQLASLAAIDATVLDVTHLVRVTAVQHLLDGRVVVPCIEGGIPFFERVPVIPEDLPERSNVHRSHDCAPKTSLRGTT